MCRPLPNVPILQRYSPFETSMTHCRGYLEFLSTGLQDDDAFPVLSPRKIQARALVPCWDRHGMQTHRPGLLNHLLTRMSNTPPAFLSHRSVSSSLSSPESGGGGGTAEGEEDDMDDDDEDDDEDRSEADTSHSGSMEEDDEEEEDDEAAFFKKCGLGELMDEYDHVDAAALGKSDAICELSSSQGGGFSLKDLASDELLWGPATTREDDSMWSCFPADEGENGDVLMAAEGEVDDDEDDDSSYGGERVYRGDMKKTCPAGASFEQRPHHHYHHPTPLVQVGPHLRMVCSSAASTETTTMMMTTSVAPTDCTTSSSAAVAAVPPPSSCWRAAASVGERCDVVLPPPQPSTASTTMAL